MLAAAALAWFLPFELFAFSYVVLGPLHYLTQISWLHDRGYFTKGKVGAPLLIAGAAIVTFAWQLDRLLLFDWRAFVTVGLFVGSVSMAYAARPRYRLPLLCLALVLTYAARQWPLIGLLGLLLPSIVHVFVFTGTFLLSGVLKQRSRSGLLSFAVFATCAALLLVVRPDAAGYSGLPITQAVVVPFLSIRDEVSRLLGIGTDWSGLIAVSRFMAWAYTYHYLNWFSKTRVIGWGDVSRARMAVIVGLYAVCLTLYAVDFERGFLIVGFVGMVHVYTEFPLDVRTVARLPALLVKGPAPT